MTATEKLRRLLDERGVEWRRTPHYSSESQDNETVFAGDGIEWYANDHLNGRLGLRALRYEVTPAQAIDATLGRGTCEWCADGKFDGQTVMMSNHGWQRINYCPSCGRRIVGG